MYTVTQTLSRALSSTQNLTNKELTLIKSANEALSLAMTTRIANEPKLHRDPTRRIETLKSAVILSFANQKHAAKQTLIDYERNRQEAITAETNSKIQCSKQILKAVSNCKILAEKAKIQPCQKDMQNLEEKIQQEITLYTYSETAYQTALDIMLESMTNKSSNPWPTLEARTITAICKRAKGLPDLLSVFDKAYAEAYKQDKISPIGNTKTHFRTSEIISVLKEVLLLGRMLSEVIPMQEKLDQLNHPSINRMSKEIEETIEYNTKNISTAIKHVKQFTDIDISENEYKDSNFIAENAKDIWLCILSAQDKFEDSLITEIMN